jgi:hypothetical protein
MSTRASAMFQVTNWDEKPYHEGEGEPKLTRATVTKTFSGDLEGEAFLEYLMVHRADGTAAFVGMERVKGKLGGKSGTFVLEHRGTHGDGTARAICRIVPGSGTGELTGLQGEGGFAARGREAPFALDYDFLEVS